MTGRAEIAACEAALRTAMLAGDADAIGQLMADDAVFTNQNGNRLAKGDDLALHRSGLLKIAAIDVQGDAEVQLLGDAAVVCCTIDLAGSYDGQPFTGAFAYTRVWQRTGERWVVKAAHCSAVAAT